MNQSFSYLQPNAKLKNLKISEDDIIDYPNGKKRRKIYENVEYDQIEIQRIQQLKRFAQDKLNLSEFEEKTILRYIYSTQSNQDCLQKLKIYYEWYKNPKVQRFDIITQQIINKGVVYTYGRDKHHRPIIYLNVSILDMSKYCIEDYLSSINAIINLVVDKMFIKGKLENYLFVIDTGNKGFSSLPLGILQDIVLKLSFVYSMRMGQMLIVNCNYIINFLYRTIAPFLNQNTKEKIKLISNSDVQIGQMKKYIDINELQQKYGGFRQNLIVKWPPSIPGKQNIIDKQLNQFSFEQSESEQYYSVMNNDQIFEKYGEAANMQEGCCTAAQCSIF